MNKISIEDADDYTTTELLEAWSDMMVELALYNEQLKKAKKIEGIIKERIKAEILVTGEIGDVLEVDGAIVHVKPPLHKWKWDEEALWSLKPHVPDLADCVSEEIGNPRIWVKTQ